ncbi:MAG: helix-turn-helix domain-containing protein [Limnochordia bacterium]|jgi:transcriptional regulator with XRE-family HTH domain
MANLKAIGARLKAARKRAGLTQEQAAAVLDVARGQISYYENGRREIDITSLIKLADLYGYSVHHFLEGSPISEEEDVELSIAFRADALSESDLDTIAWIKRFTRNLSELDSLVSEEKRQ